MVYTLIGDVLVKQDKTAEAREVFKKDLEIAQRLADAAPQSIDRQHDLMLSHFNLGEQDEAPQQHYAVALAIARRLRDAGRLEPDYDWLIPALEERLGGTPPP